MGRLLFQNIKTGSNQTTLILSEGIAEGMWEAMGWVYEQRPNAALETLRHVFFNLRGTCWW